MNFNITPVVRNLLILNLAVYIIDAFIFHLTDFFALKYIFHPGFYPFQFVTYMFLHGSFSHLFFNMFALFMFGPLMEQTWGSKKFLIFYMVTGAGAGFFYTLINFVQLYDLQSSITAYVMDPTPGNFTIFINKYMPDNAILSDGTTLHDFMRSFSDNPSSQVFVKESIQLADYLYKSQSNFELLGASGAVFGILMAFGLTFPRLELMIFPFPIPIKAWLYVSVYGLLELYMGVHNEPGDNVAHFAHIGGMLFAFIMIWLWRKRGSNYY